MEQEDYSKIYEYESMGKEYAGEKACISLTSWKARINTVSKTLYSLIKMCPGFHIVLVLSKDEFPLMEKELPDNLMLFVENKLIELFWIRPNLKSFKKVLFTMDKYRDVPVISADDDCIYTCNYAQELYNAWLMNKSVRFSLQNASRFGLTILGGCSVIYPPNYFSMFNLSILKQMTHLTEDDMLYALLSKKFNLKGRSLRVDLKKFIIFSNSIKPLSAIRHYDSKSDYYKIKKILSIK